MKQFKIVVEKHPDVYVSYPLGLKGVVVGQGDTRGGFRRRQVGDSISSRNLWSGSLRG